MGAAAFCAPLCDCANAEPAVLPTPALKTIAAGKGIVFGSEVHGPMPWGGGASAFDDPGYRALLLHECAAIEPGIEMKWPVVEPRPGTYDFGPADCFMAFASANNLKARGINIVWMNAAKQPQWLAPLAARPDRANAAEALVRQRAQMMCSRYGDRIFSWDVANEAIDDITGLPRPSVLAAAMGGIEPVMDAAFHAAREAAPRAELVYNDFMTWSVASAKHRAGVLKLLEGFRKRGTPVDALGIQAHIVGVAPTDTASMARQMQTGEWRAFLDAVTAMGYRLVVTEFDVDDQTLPTLYGARDQAVADTAERYLDLTLSYPALHTLMLWGLVDRYSWLQSETSRRDHLERRPNPYDDSDSPKPMRAAIARALAGAPAR